MKTRDMSEYKHSLTFSTVA